MQKFNLIHYLILLLTVFLMTGCGQNPWSKDPEYYIVDVTGVEFILNSSNSFGGFVYRAMDEDDTLTIVVSEGDLLSLGEVNYRYDPDDGLCLRFSEDSVIDAIYLNDEVYWIYLDKGSKTWEWMDQAAPGAIENLDVIFLADTVTEANISSLEKLSQINNNLVVFNDCNNDTLDQYLLTLFAPTWHDAEILKHQDYSADAKSNLRELELVLFTDYDSTCLETLYDLPRLNSLIIEDWDSSEIAGLQFDILQKLRSLTIVESEVYDLSSLGTLPKLKDLNLVGCDNLEIGPLAELTGLRSLGFTVSELLWDTLLFQELPMLSRLSLPYNTTQEEFAGIIDGQKSLQVLELIICEEINDLSPLEGYAGLKALTLSEVYPDISALYQMKDLDLLVLGESYYKDSLGMVKLQNALPDTKIVQGGGLCVGSGWLLLLMPVVILLFMLKRKKQ